MALSRARQEVELQSKRARDVYRSVFLAAPIEKQSVAVFLQRFGHSHNQVLREFVECFDGLRISAPPMAGGFVPIAEWTKQRNGAVVVFNDRNGDEFLLHRDGAVAIRDAESPRSRPRVMWPSFEHMLANERLGLG